MYKPCFFVKNQKQRGKVMKKNKTQLNYNPLNNIWFAIIVFILGTTLLGFLASVGGGRMQDYLNWERPPISALPICYFVTKMIMYLMLGISIYLVYKEPNRKKYNKNIDLICFYSQLAFYFFFPLFFFRLGLLIFSSVWLGISIILAIITLVRFWANNLAAGIMYSTYTLWLLYLFYVTLGITLLA